MRAEAKQRDACGLCARWGGFVEKTATGELTERQREVLGIIVEYITAHGFPPTQREIGEAAGITSTNGVADHLAALERKGFISRRAEVARGIRVLVKP
jgi:repressor LexA